MFKVPSPDLNLNLGDTSPVDLTDPSHRLIANVKVQILSLKQIKMLKFYQGYRLDTGQPFIAHPPIGKQLTFLEAERDILHYALNFLPHGTK